MYEPAGTLPQRGWLDGDHRKELQRLVLAVSLRGTLAPDVPEEFGLPRTPEQVRGAKQQLRSLFEGGRLRLPDHVVPRDFQAAVIDEVFVLGPLESFLGDDNVSEVMVNGPYIIFIERDGEMLECGHKFLDDEHLERVIKRIASRWAASSIGTIRCSMGGCRMVSA